MVNRPYIEFLGWWTIELPKFFVVPYKVSNFFICIVGFLVENVVLSCIVELDSSSKQVLGCTLKNLSQTHHRVAPAYNTTKGDVSGGSLDHDHGLVFTKNSDMPKEPWVNKVCYQSFCTVRHQFYLDLEVSSMVIWDTSMLLRITPKQMVVVSQLRSPLDIQVGKFRSVKQLGLVTSGCLHPKKGNRTYWKPN